MIEHGVNIEIPRGTIKEELTKSLNYGVNTSSVKDKYFVSQDMVEHIMAGNVVIFSLENIHNLEALWL